MADSNNKTHLHNAATKIEDFIASVSSTLDTIKSGIKTLVQQAQSPHPTEEPEDLSEELAALDTALGDMSGFATNLRGVADSIPQQSSGPGPTQPANPTPTTPPADSGPTTGQGDSPDSGAVPSGVVVSDGSGEDSGDEVDATDGVVKSPGVKDS